MVDFDAARREGLSAAEARARLGRDGPNELPAARRRGVWALAGEVAREPMFLLLLAGGTMYLLLGDVREAAMLLSFVFVIMTITFVQERRTERALSALRELSSPRARVVRDGEARRVAGREVVCGDVVLLAEGDRVAADGLLQAGLNLSVDESLLTGESAPVRKAPDPAVTAPGRPGGDDTPCLYSGTLVLQGQGVMRVTATGAATALGRIGGALHREPPTPTPLQRQTRALLWTFGLIGGGLSALVVLIFGLTRGQWISGALVGISLAMGILPDEFAVVLVLFLALGAWRLARQQVLTRRMAALETLGAATVLCVDKTGTLTENRMTVTHLYAHGRAVDAAAPLPDDFHELVEYGVLASQTDPFDPTERAIRALGEEGLAHTEHLHADWTLEREYPLSRALLAMSHAWRAPGGAAYVIAAKGAPEAIADLCHLDDARQADLARAVQALAEQGLRVLGVAQARVDDDVLPGLQHDFPFAFVGLLGLCDPLRPTVPAAVRTCHTAGIRVMMITGDYPATAQAVARAAGLPATPVITGAELDALSDDELRRRVAGAALFARMVPEQKLRLVNAFKANGEIVAMTGDGVNDAPALKAAHIGIAMGGHGADVAREAAALVLLEDSFAGIVDAIRMGRRVHANLNKAMAYILAIHVPIAGMTLIPVVLAWPLVLLPVHIAFLHLLIDPACSVAFEAEPADPEAMTRPPRAPDAPLFSRRALVYSLLQGGSLLLGVLAVFAVAWGRGQGVAEARTLMFTTLVVANAVLVLMNRSWTHSLTATLRVPNPAAWGVLAGAAALLTLVLRVPVLRDLFRFTALHADDLLLCLLAGVGSVLWFEGVKRLTTRRAPRYGLESA